MSVWLAEAQGDDAATPLTPVEREGLIPTYITNRAELNEAEQLNIQEADTWAFRRERDVLDHGFLVSMYKRMPGKACAGPAPSVVKSTDVSAWTPG